MAPPSFPDRAATVASLPRSPRHHRLPARIHSPTLLEAPTTRRLLHGSIFNGRHNQSPSSCRRQVLSVVPNTTHASLEVPRIGNARRRLPLYASSRLPPARLPRHALPHPTWDLPSTLCRPFNDATPTASSWRKSSKRQGNRRTGK